MTLYGTPQRADDSTDLVGLSSGQESLRVRVCAAATNLHDRLVVLAHVQDVAADDKDAVRAWLFANHPDEQFRPARNRVPAWDW